MTNEEILKSLEGLEKPDFDVHVIHDAWYSVRAMTRALGHESYKNFPEVSAVRIGLKHGMLELHPEGDKVHVRCYCCFGGDEEKGLVSLDTLKYTVMSFKDHECPPWPG